MNRTDVMILDLDLSIRGNWAYGVQDRLEHLIILLGESSIPKELADRIGASYRRTLDVVDKDPYGERYSIDGRSVSWFNYIYNDEEDVHRRGWTEYDYEYYKANSIYLNVIVEKGETIWGSDRFRDYYGFSDSWDKIQEFIKE